MTRSSEFQESQIGYNEWFCPKTGICNSKYPYIHLPDDPYLDVVNYIFSHEHKGVRALIDSSSGFSLSYTELLSSVKSIALNLQKMGVSRGYVVMLLLPNSIYLPPIVLGILYAGAVFTTMNPLSTPSEIQKQATDCSACLAFSSSDKADILKSLNIPFIEVPDNPNCEPNSSYLAFENLMSSKSDFFRDGLSSQDDTAAILYSSGTTGVSKGVILSHRNIIAMVELFVRFEASLYDDIASENVYVAAIPMFHIYGISLFVMGLLSLGSSIVVMKKFHSTEAVNAIDRFRVTHFPLVPPIMAALVKKADGMGRHSLSSLKQISCGAASLSMDYVERFLLSYPHVDIIQGYGMTESSAVGTRGFNTESIRKYSSIGLLAPNMHAKVVECDRGFPLPPGETGELCLRGPSIMKGYLNNMEATMATIDKSGWLHTGDIVRFDEDGYLYMVDRMKDIIKHRGFQIAPADLEAVLVSHPHILDAAVIAVKDDNDDEVPAAFVVKNPQSDVSEADIMNKVANEVAPHKKVRKVVFVESIPKLASGKILRRELKALWESRSKL